MVVGINMKLTGPDSSATTSRESPPVRVAVTLRLPPGFDHLRCSGQVSRCTSNWPDALSRRRHLLSRPGCKLPRL